ncbi:hypothetical protein GCM10011309_10060 [Litorimonas cladophorae]|uniref:Cadherin domain-containing protein n=1 Tax=Litorimonas cladophorae TaxID=1220491 RepID=A0A918KHR9_9PROT|nr:cadherin domain-containing protein [Litorimonas cladophorae]GGX62110.1 hypothetical protein GCM10011309_10060 [Litorimonas cladophorae]
MTRSFFSGNQKALSGYKARLSGVSLAALALLGIAGPANAQDVGVEVVPDGFQAANSIKDFKSITSLADGTVEVLLASGETVSFAAAEVAIVGGQVFVAEAAIAAAGLTIGSAAISTVAIAAAGAAAAGTGAFALSKGESNDAPIFSSPLTTTASENQTSAFTATATDADNDSLTYTLSGTDAGLFTINGSTGVVTFNGAPDFESPADANGDNTYTVTVTASDGAEQVSQTVNISVTDENETPVISVVEATTVDENQTAAFTATATDVDGDALSYALSGADAALFAIDAATGVVTFIDTPDFEAPADADGDNVYDVTVTATDGTLSTSQDVAITVADVNEAPVVTSGPAFTAAENQTAAFTASATDVDGDALSYALSGADAALFAIDAATGVVTFIDTPDFEAPADADGDNVYDVTVTATDGELSSSQDVAITVTDVNEAPVVTSGPAFTAAENQTAAFTATATDVDGDALSYALSGADAALFAIDAAAGVVTFIETPDFEAPADADGDNVYDVTVTATDGELINIEAVSISVADVDDTAPDAPIILSVGLVNIFTASENGDGGSVQFLPAITGTAEAGSTVEIFDGTTSLGTAIADTDGAYFLSTSSASLRGDTLSATATDAAGNLSEAAILAEQYGYNPGGYFEENSAPFVLEDGIGEDSGFIVLQIDGQNFAPIVSDAGDVNNDGFDDILVGIGEADANGEDSGLVAVVFGGEGGFGTSVDGVSTINLDTLAAEDGFLVAGEAGGDYLRPVSSAGDFNGDGIDDFVIGATGVDLFAPNAGASYIIFGQEGDFAETDETGQQIIDLSALTPAQGLVFVGGEDSGRLGYDVSDAGDVNGDGIADLLLSDTDYLSDGGVFVVYGTTETLGETAADGRHVVDLSNLTADQGFLVTNASSGYFLGFTVAAVGDINSDGIDDFGLSDPTGQGAAYVIFGSPDGSGTPDSSGLSVLSLAELSASEGIQIIGTDASPTTVGISVAGIGDFNGDGFNDVLVGASDSFGSGTGEAYVIFGDETGFGSDDGEGGLLLDVSTLTADQGVLLSGLPGSFAGFRAEGIGDFNNDGFADVIITSANLSFSTIIFGGDEVGALNDDGQSVVNLGDLGALEGLTLVGNRLGDGLSAAGDVNGDGVDDVVVGLFGQPNGSASALVLFGGQQFEGLSETLAFVDENTTSAFVATSLGEGTSYLLEGEDAELFSINQDTGLVSFIVAPDFEAIFNTESLNGVLADADTVEDLEALGYNVSVVAINGDFVTHQDAYVTVTDVNEFAPSINAAADLASSNGLFAFRAADEDGSYISISGFEIDENGIKIPTFAENLTFEIVGGADADLFVVANSFGAQFYTGLIGFADLFGIDAPTDANGDGVYEVEIAVSDGDFTTTQMFNLNLVEGGESPVFTSDISFNVDEFEGEASFQISAIDPEGADILYSIISPDEGDASLFSIDLLTGELMLNDALSFSTPLDANLDNVYNVTIAAFDGTNFTLETFDIAVTNLEFAPTVPVGATDRNISENNIAGYGEVIVATDLDFDVVSATITGGADAAFFSVTPEYTTSFGETGFDLRINQSFDFEAPDDSDADNVYEVEITFSDGLNETVELIQFTVLDLFESANAPIFSTPNSVIVEEGQTTVLTINADDADGETLTYSLANSQNDANFFDLDSATGELSFAYPIDFNQPDSSYDNIYTIDVIADDGSFNQTVQTITIEVIDVDVAPTIDVQTEIVIDENELGSFTVSARESFDDQLITLTLQGGDEAAFGLVNGYTSLGYASGQIEFQPVDFENPTDGDGDNVYTVDVVASDGVNTVRETITVTVRDVFESENAPVFTSVNAVVVDEGPGTVLTVVATDADGEIPTYSITGGENQFVFDIDDQTGELGFSRVVAFDPIGDNTYEVEVTADDGSSNQTTQTITVELLNADVAPEFFSNGQTDATIFENDMSAPLSFQVRDNYDNAQLTISLEGNDADLFEIQFSSNSGGYAAGALNFIIPPDFEMPRDANGDNVYELAVVASDGVNVVTQTYSVTVEDLFESANAPIFSTPTSLTVDEAQAFIASINADDADGEAVAYSITGGASSYLFGIDSETGDLNFIYTPPEFNPYFPESNIYEVEITADDGSQNQTAQIFTIEVLDVNLVPTLTIPDFVTIIENETYSTFVSASDRDSDSLLQLSLGGADADLFSLTIFTDYNGYSTAQLELISPLDFETPLDADGDNVYELEISVTDGVNIVTDTISLTVEDLFETLNAPVFTTPTVLSVDEGQDSISTINATDADGELPIYSITGGEDGFRFAVDPVTGELSFSQQTRFNQPDNSYNDNFYTVEVTADDGSGNQTSQSITVEVLDVDVAPTLSVPETRVVDENESLSFSVTAREDYDRQVLTLSLGGDDAEFFTLTGGYNYSGYAFSSVELIAPLDFETPLDADGDNVYEIEVIVTDGVNIVTEIVSITVADVFESANAPVFTTATTSIVEETNTFVLTVSADDLDGETPTYSVTGGEDQYFFYVDSYTGELNFYNPPRFNQADDFADNVYTVEVTADDGSGNQTTQTITIEVTDIDVAPTVSVSPTYSGDENESLSFFVSGRDFDLDSVTLSLGGEDAAAFELINSFGYDGYSQGTIEFIGLPDFENPTDSDGDNIYILEVSASDGTSVTTETIAVTVRDVFESANAPVFVSPNSLVVDEVREIDLDGAYDFFVTQVSATDVDGETPTYSLPYDPQTAGFYIDYRTGEVSHSGPLLFDNAGEPGDNIFNLLILADDGTGNVTEQILSVEVADVNFAPFLDRLGQTESDDIFVPENQVLTTSFSYSDYPDFDDLTVTLGGEDASAFDFSAVSSSPGFITGHLNLVSPLDFESPTDSDGDGVYLVELIVSDGVNTFVDSIAVTVTDVLEIGAPPAFVTPRALSIDEGIAVVGLIEATDVDGDEISYEITAGGDDRFEFSLGGIDGNELSFNFAPEFDFLNDFNGDGVFEVEISAFDGDNTTTQLFEITINDVNFTPTLSVSDGFTYENEVDPALFVNGSDYRDFNDVLTLSLSGPDALLFQFVNSYTYPGTVEARIEFVAAPDFELPLDADGDNVYELTVELSDGVNTVSDNLSITVGDLDDSPISANAPVFVTEPSLSIDEGQTTVTSLFATDADGDNVTFEITGGDDNIEFALIGPDADTLAFAYTTDATFLTDANSDGEYEVEVTASDGGNTTTQTFFVRVNDVNTPPDLTVNNGTTPEGDVFTGSVIAADDFNDFGDTLTISLSGDDAAFFTVATSLDGPGSFFGDIEFVVAPDFETPLDANGDNVYDVTVEVFDGLNTVTQDITITVDDMPEDESGTVKTGDPALSSFSVEDDDVIDLTANGLETFTAEEIFPAELVFKNAPTAEIGPEQALFEQDINAMEMQFIADLLMVQDSGAAIDG